MCPWSGNISTQAAVDTSAIAQRLVVEFGVERQILPAEIAALLLKLRESDPV